MPRIHTAPLVALLASSLMAPAAARQDLSVTQADIQRLQDNVYQVSADLSRLRSRDPARADQLQAELDELREEVIYLKVKLRKERSLARREYAGVRDRIEDVHARALARTSPPSEAAEAGGATVERGTRSATTIRTSGAVEIPAGTEMDVRLSNSLSSGTAQVEDRFEATTLVDLSLSGRTVVPAGSVVRGVVSAVAPATRTNRTARMTVSFDQITINGHVYPLRGTLTQAIEGEGLGGEVGRISAGAGVGAIIGGILGGVKGALAGILIGAGGTIAATEGKEVELPQGSVLRVRIDSPVTIARQ